MRCVAALAIAGLYLQLAAVALCTAGLPSGSDLLLFPICHSAVDGNATPKPGHAPQQSCPFCALHCHAAMALPPALHFVKPTSLATGAPAPLATSQPPLRFAIAAEPRGPPHLS